MLLSRLQAVMSPVEKQQEAPLIPYDTVRDWLETHDVVVATRVDPFDVHACLVDLHTWLQRPQPATVAPVPLPPPPTCDACKRTGYLDERDGAYACQGCGAVLLANVNVTREWIDPAQESWHTACHPNVRGVSRPVLESILAPVVSDPVDRRSKHWEDLEHWNQFTHVGTDELRRWDRVLRNFGAHSHTSLVCIVACLLYSRMRFDITDVRTRMLRGLPLESGHVPVPEARFPCAACGHRLHRKRDARFHCR